jgi:LPXTG-motif cell wall-anchored protein
MFISGALNQTFEVINDESLALDSWRDEFKNLETDEFGIIATGNLPINYILFPLVILVLIIYLFRRRRKKRL